MRTPVRLLAAPAGLVVAALLLSVAPAQAAGTDDATPPGKAWVRAGQFAAGLGAVRVQLTPRTGSGMTLAQDVSYGTVSTYRQVEPGAYTVSVRPNDAAADAQPMLRRSLTVVAGKAGTVALLGTAKSPRLAALGDDLTPPGPGSARVRVLSGSADASDLTVQAVGGPTIASGVVLGQATGYTSVPQGSWTLALDDGSGVRARQTVRLAGGGIYTAVVVDASAKKVRLKLVTDAQGATMVPKGGAATGLGGTVASPRAVTPVDLLAGALALLAGGAALALGRSRVRPVRR